MVRVHCSIKLDAVRCLMLRKLSKFDVLLKCIALLSSVIVIIYDMDWNGNDLEEVRLFSSSQLPVHCDFLLFVRKIDKVLLGRWLHCAGHGSEATLDLIERILGSELASIT